MSVEMLDVDCSRVDCACCSTWQQADESREEWHARLRLAISPRPAEPVIPSCPQGHPREGNTRINSQAARICIACNREWCAAYKRRQKGATA